MLSFAVKHLKTCSSLRNTRNYIAQLSIANPKELRVFTWRKVRAWNFRSDLTAPNHNSVRKTAYPVFQEMLHMWEIQSSQLKTSELCSSTWWTTRILGRVKRKIRACLLKSNCHTNGLISKPCKYLLPLPFDSLRFISSTSLKSAAFHCIHQLIKGKQERFLHLKKQDFNFENIWIRQ